MLSGKLNPQVSIDYDTTEKIFEHTITTADTNAKLLCLFEGADEATTGTADTGQTITFAGTAQIDTAQAKIGTASLLLDGNSDYVTVPDSADWAFGAGDFTIDMWVRFNSVAASSMFVNQRSGGGGTEQWYCHWNQGSSLLHLYGAVSGSAIGHYTCSWTPSVDTWYHLAFERSGTGAYIFVDGVSQELTETTAFSTNSMPNCADVLSIGRINTPDGYHNGWIDAFRVTKGTALWTANFTPPTTPNDYVTATSISIFGLEGDTDEVYMLDCLFITTVNNSNMSYRFNGDSGTNYGYQELRGLASVIAAGRGTISTGYICGGLVAGEIGNGNILIHAKSGYVRTAIENDSRNVDGTTVGQVSARGRSWNNTTDEITSITIFTTGAGTMAVGSVISLYRRITA